MPKIWNKKPIAVLQAEAAEVEFQELMTHGSVPLKRTLSAMSLTALGSATSSVPAYLQFRLNKASTEKNLGIRPQPH
jgi:hypothetical protein